MVMVIPVVSAELTKEEVDSLTSIEKTVNNLEISLEASLKSLETSSNTCNDVKTLINNKPIMTMHGTEYQVKDNAKVWLQLLHTNQTPIITAVCYIDIYTPNNLEYTERALMTNMVHDGIYYYDLTAPSTVGVYPAIALCYYNAGQTALNSTSYVINNGTYNNGSINDTYFVNGVFLSVNESSPNITTTAQKSPQAYSDDYNDWVTPENANVSDNVYSTRAYNSYKQDWYNFNFNIPNGSIIDGITISIEGSALTPVSSGVGIDLSWNGGSSYTTSGQGYTTTNTTDVIRVFGNNTYTWGRTWNATELNNTNFRLRVNKTGTDLYQHKIDNIMVNVSYSFGITAVNRQLEVEYDFKESAICNVTEILLTGVSISTTSRWQSGTANDDITIWIYNYTSGSWMALPNKILQVGTGWKGVSNTLMFNNISNAGLVNGSGTNVRIKFNDTNLTDTITNSFDLDQIQLLCEQLTDPLFQEVRGSSELHITDFVNNLNASIGSPSAIADAVWNYNGTINLNVLIQISGEVWNWGGSIASNILDLISGNVWTYSERNLTYTPDQNISTQVVNVSIDENTIADAVWTHTPDRNLTFYETSNVTVNGTDIAQQVWNYNGTINDNILNQVADKVQCYVNQLFSTEDGQWGIDISAC